MSGTSHAITRPVKKTTCWKRAGRRRLTEVAGPHPQPHALGRSAGLSAWYLKRNDEAQAYGQQLPVSQGQVAVPVPKCSVSVGAKCSCYRLCPLHRGCHRWALLQALSDLPAAGAQQNQPLASLSQGPGRLLVAQPQGTFSFAKAPPSATGKLLLQPRARPGKQPPHPCVAPHMGTLRTRLVLGCARAPGTSGKWVNNLDLAKGCRAKQNVRCGSSR